MADGSFKIAVKARDLLSYTNRLTRIISDDVSIRDVRDMFRQLASASDLGQVHGICNDVVHKLDVRKREGFTKSQYRLYGEDIRQIAKAIVRDIQSANNVHFAVDYDMRLARLDTLLDDCALLVEYVQICVDEGIISTKKAGVWTEKIMEIKKMAGSWKMKDASRAAELREAAEKEERRKEVAMMASAVEEAVRRIRVRPD